MNRIKEELLQNRGMLVTDFDGTLTLFGSSLHGAVHVLGENSGLAVGRDRLFQRMGRGVLRAAKRGQEKEALNKRAEDWWKEQMELYVREGIGEEILKKGGKAAASQERNSGTPGVLQKGNFAGLDRLCRLGKCDPLLAGGTGNLGNGDPGAGQ